MKGVDKPFFGVHFGFCDSVLYLWNKFLMISGLVFVACAVGQEKFFDVDNEKYQRHDFGKHTGIFVCFDIDNY